MLHKFIFIGIGGSGGKTLRYLHNNLAIQLGRLGITEFPSAWQFLHVDTPMAPDSDDPDLPLDLPSGSYHGMVGDDVTYLAIEQQIQNKGTRAWEAAAGWLPRSAEVHINVEDGAGQYRALGRAIGVAAMDRLSAKLVAAVNRMGREHDSAELRHIDRLRNGAQPSGPAPHPTVVVIASLAGGTGAGLFLDVCNQLRLKGLGPWAGDSVAVLYTADVFDRLPVRHRQGVQANALACVAELLAGYWNEEPFGQAEAELLSGAAGTTIKRRGPKYPFLVSRSNGKFTYTHEQDVFRAVGKTLATWALSRDVQGQVRSYFGGNWQSTAAREDYLESGEQLRAPFASLGCASLELGRGRFRLYARRGLARHALEVLIDKQTASEADAGGTVEQRALQRLGAFQRDVGLFNAGRAEGQLIQKLNPIVTRGSSLTDTRAALRRQLLREQRAALEVWTERVTGAVTSAEPYFMEDQRAELRRLAKQWVSEIQERLVSEVERRLATDGFRVTRRLLALTIQDLRRAASQELPNLRTYYQRRAQELETQVREQLTGGAAAAEGSRWRSWLRRRGSDVRPDDERIGAALEAALSYRLQGRLGDELCEVAISLLSAFDGGFLAPLQEQLAKANRELQTAAQGGRGAVGRGTGSDPRRWPDTKQHAVPADLQPDPNELLLDQIGEFPAIFQEKLAECFEGQLPGGGMPSFADAMPLAISAALLGEDGVQGQGRQRLVERATSWVPPVLAEWDDTEVERRAGFRVNLTPAKLLAFADDWIGQERHALGRYLGESLRDHLNADPTLGVDQEARLLRFENQFARALELADPLTELDPETVARFVGEGMQPPYRIITPVPLADTDPAYEVALRVLLDRAGLEEETAKQLIRHGSGSDTDIEISTFLSAPQPPMVFKTLMKPVLDDWTQKRSRQAERREFAKWRRTRALPEFVPTPPDVRLTMVRGWYTALVLGQLSLNEPNEPLTVRDEADHGDWLPFPYPMPLDDPPGGRPAPEEALAAVLESLPIALAAFSQLDKTAIAPYRRLVELGKPQAGPVGEYQGFSRPLERWVETGELLNDHASVTAELLTVSARGTVLQRRQYLRESYARLLRDLQAGVGVGQPPRRRDPDEVRPTRGQELRADLLVALRQLINACGGGVGSGAAAEAAEPPTPPVPPATARADQEGS